ncbi:hypothetical protein ACLOJK_022629 [Asimina triloba]
MDTNFRSYVVADRYCREWVFFRRLPNAGKTIGMKTVVNHSWYALTSKHFDHEGRLGDLNHHHEFDGWTCLAGDGVQMLLRRGFNLNRPIGHRTIAGEWVRQILMKGLLDFGEEDNPLQKLRTAVGDWVHWQP